MIITRCPRCEKEVLIPAGAAPEAKVRCPLCSAEYELGDAMQDLPPALELLEAPASVEPAASHYPPEDNMFQEDDLDMFAAGATATEAAEEQDDSSFSFDEASETETSETAEGASFSFEEVSEQESTTENEELAMGEPADISAAPSPFEFGGGGGGGGTATASARVASSQRKKKKQKSPVVLILEVVGGGIAAMIIVQFILWWTPGSFIPNRDPFGLAAKLPSAIAWIAPANLRGGETTPSAETDTRGAQGSQPVEPPAESGFGEFEDKFNDAGDDSALDGHADHDHDSGGFDVSAFPGNEHDDHAHDEEVLVDPLRDAFGPGDEADFVENESPAIDVLPLGPTEVLAGNDEDDLGEDELAADQTNNEESDGGDEVIEGVGSSVAVEETQDEEEDLKPVSVQQLVRDLNAARIAFNTRQNNQSSDVARAYYLSLCRLTESLDNVDLSAEGLTEAALDVRGLFEKIGDNSDEFIFLGRVGAGWLHLASRESDEVVISGTVESIEPAGSLYTTRLQIANTDKTIDVLTEIDPQDLPESLRELLGTPRVYGVGSQVIIAGAIVDDPESSVVGYEGDAQQAIWSVCAVEIPE